MLWRGVVQILRSWVLVTFYRIFNIKSIVWQVNISQRKCYYFYWAKKDNNKKGFHLFGAKPFLFKSIQLKLDHFTCYCRTRNSTRRFFILPFFVVLSATGFCSPYPFDVNLSGLMPLPARYFLTERALFEERFIL